MRRFVLAALILLTMGLSSAGADTLANIVATKTLRIGFIDGQAPFSVKSADGLPTGYAIDLCQAAGATIKQQVPGLNITYVETTLIDAFHDINVNKIDLLCGAVTASLNRRELVNFSQPIFSTGVSAVFRTDAPADIRSLLLNDREISPPRSLMLRAFASHIYGVRADSATETALRAAMKAMGATVSIVGYDNHAAGLTALAAHQIDAYFADRALLLGALQQRKDADRFVVSNRWLTREPYGIAFVRNDDDLRLLVDRSLSAFYRGPAFIPTVQKYFGRYAPDVAGTILLQALPE